MFDGMFDGTFDGMFDGMYDGLCDGTFDGMFDGMCDGMFDGIFDGMFDGISCLAGRHCYADDGGTCLNENVFFTSSGMPYIAILCRQPLRACLYT